MTGLSRRLEVYKALIEYVLRDQRDMVTLERLNLFLSKAKRKYPLLRDIEIDDGRNLTIPDNAMDDEEAALKNLSTVIACIYKALEMFMGSGHAKDMVLESISTYRKDHPEIEDLDLSKYLPRKEEDQEEEGIEEEEEVEDMEDIDDVAAAEILKPKDEGVPFYDEKKKEWVLKPAHIVKKVKEEAGDGLEPVFEEGVLKRRVVKKTLKKVEEEPERAVETFQWLQQDFPVGSSYVVEGTGQEKNMLSAQFLKEGLEAGEDVIAIVGYPPKLLLTQLQKIGVVEKDLEKVHIIDWHTFKEKHVVDVESSDSIHIVPKDPKFMGSVLTKILGTMGKDGKKRAFVSIVSYALAFIDLETVFNFVQITKLKFEKANVTGLFTIEAGQHGKEVRSAFKDTLDGLIRIKEGMSGANTWKMKAEIKLFTTKDKAVKDVVIMRNGIVVLERKAGKEEKDALEELGLPTDIEEVVSGALEDEPAIDSYLMDKMEMWKGLGFNVEQLEEAVDDGNDVFKEILEDFEKEAGRALEIRGRLDEVATKVRSIRDRGLGEEVLDMRKKIRDLEDLDGVEEGVDKIEIKLRSKAAKETKRRDREKEIFRIRMEHWARQGYDTNGLESVMDEDLETVNKEFAEFRSVVNSLKHIEEELNKMDTLGHEDHEKAIRKRLFDVDEVEETLSMFDRLKEDVMVKEKMKSTAESRRNELMDEVFNWALEGYCVDLMDQIDIFREDLGTLENRLSRLRKRVERLKQAEEDLNGLDLSRHRNEEMQIRSILKDVDRVDEVERKVLGLREKLGGKISGEVMALDANIERVRELEETWQKLKSRLLAESRMARKENDGQDNEG